MASERGIVCLIDSAIEIEANHGACGMKIFSQQGDGECGALLAGS
jgi:hypothetical protein